MKLSELVLATVGTAVGTAAVTVIGALAVPVVKVAAGTVAKAAAITAVGAAAATAGYLLCTESVINACETSERGFCND